MTTKFVIYPYKLTSESAKALATNLGAKRVRIRGNYVPKENHILINWGNSNFPWWSISRPGKVLNNPIHIRKACNKLTTFQILKEANVPIPDWTQSPETADNWVQEGYTVFGRKTLTGHSGQGIILFNEELVIPRDICPLYTKYTKCKHEYRVHVFQGRIIDFVRKKKRESVEANQYIRSCDNGWVFCREGVELPECVKQAALGAIQALGLDFGAVDIGYNTRENKAYTYEINTAPGLEGTTLVRYTEAFTGLLT